MISITAASIISYIHFYTYYAINNSNDAIIANLRKWKSDYLFGELFYPFIKIYAYLIDDCIILYKFVYVFI